MSDNPSGMATDTDHDYAFEMAASAMRFGVGVTREVGADLAELGVREGARRHRSDRRRAAAGPDGGRLARRQPAVACALYDRVRVEPTDESFLDAIAFAAPASYDAFVAVGGGSTIDTAKAVNLYATYPPADFLDYVNPPIGKGLPVPGPLKPLIAIPTTAGTGSETTGVSIFDLTRLHAKTGIANRRLKPTLGLLDPENTRTMPPEVAASSGLDILSHAIESFTAMPFTGRPRPDRPAMRPGLPGIQPDQRRLVAAGAADGRDVPGPRRRRPGRRRGARADAAGGVVRGRRLRQCRRAPAARHVVSGVGQREELPRAGVRMRIIRSCRTASR